MTTHVATTSRRPALALPAQGPREPLVTTLVEVLACGDPGHGDDGAPGAALAELGPDLPADVTVRLVGQLGIDDLLAVQSGAGTVVVDTATGIDPGWVVEIPFIGFAGRESGMRTRSSAALSRPETVAVASMIRGRPLVGVLVAIGGSAFGSGDALSWPVSTGLRSFRVAIADAIDRVRAQVVAAAVANG